MKNLALKVRGIHFVHIQDTERSYPGSSEVKRRRRTQSAGADHQHLLLKQGQLALLPHLRQEQVALIAVALLGRERRRLLPRLPFILPTTEPAGHRNYVRIAELTERLGGKGGPHAASAIHDDRYLVIGDAGLDLGLQMTTGNMHHVG